MFTNAKFFYRPSDVLSFCVYDEKKYICADIADVINSKS